MESREAADDILERLNGSSVQGWTEKLEVRLIASGTNPAAQVFNPQPSAFHHVHSRSFDMPPPPAPLPTQDFFHEPAPHHQRLPSWSSSSYKSQADDDLSSILSRLAFQTPDIRSRSSSLGYNHTVPYPQANYESRDTYNPRLLHQLAELQLLRMQQQQQGNYSSQFGHGGNDGILNSLSASRDGMGSFGSTGVGLARSTGKVPGPILTPSTAGNGVPYLLPALSPTHPDSPEGSMSSVPSTPITFQLPRSTRTSMTNH